MGFGYWADHNIAGWVAQSVTEKSGRLQIVLAAIRWYVQVMYDCDSLVLAAIRWYAQVMYGCDSLGMSTKRP